MSTQAQTITFLNRDSANSVIQGTDGNFYGTGGGGANDLGQIFRMTPPERRARFTVFAPSQLRRRGKSLSGPHTRKRWQTSMAHVLDVATTTQEFFTA